MKTKIALILIMIALSVSVVSWHSDHVRLSQTIDRQSAAIQDQDDCLMEVFKAMGNINVAEITKAQTNLFPPSWADVEAQPYYVQASIDKRAKIVGAWITQNFIAYDGVCNSLSNALADEGDKFKQAANDGKIVAYYSASLEAKNADLEQELQNSKSDTQGELAELSAKLDQNKNVLDLMNAQNKEATEQAAERAQTDAVIKAGASAFDDPSKTFPLTPIDPDLFKSPYHDYTVITPNGVTQATVIDNN